MKPFRKAKDYGVVSDELEKFKVELEKFKVINTTMGLI